MKVNIRGKEYELVDQHEPHCVDCVAVNDDELCELLPMRCTKGDKKVWKEVKDDSASKDV